jgi:hypothetical protein
LERDIKLLLFGRPRNKEERKTLLWDPPLLSFFADVRRDPGERSFYFHFPLYTLVNLSSFLFIWQNSYFFFVNILENSCTTLFFSTYSCDIPFFFFVIIVIFHFSYINLVFYFYGKYGFFLSVTPE